MLQHVWTYKPLVHDVLGMHANSITIEAKAEPGQMPGTTSKKRYEVCPLAMLWNLKEIHHVISVLSKMISAKHPVHHFGVYKHDCNCIHLAV